MGRFLKNHIIILKLDVTKNFRQERTEGKRNVCPQIYEGFPFGRSIKFFLISFTQIYQDQQLKNSRKIFQLGVGRAF